MSAEVMQEIADSIKYGDKQRARELLAPILASSPTAEAHYLASQLTDSPQEMIAELRKAVALDPDHDTAKRALDAMESMYGREADAAPAPDAESDAAPAPTPTPEPQMLRKEGTAAVYHSGTYEMLWDCKFCGTKKLLGKSQKFCPVCGAQQDPAWRYFPSDEEKVALEDHEFVGADLRCPACDTLNSADATYCISCGSPLEAGKAVGTLGAREGKKLDTEDLDRRQQLETDQRIGRDSIYSQQARAEAEANKPNRVMQGVIGAIVLAVIGFGIFALTARQEVSAFATGFTWERSIDIERYEAFSRSRQCPAPAGAYNVTQRREVVGQERVQVGEDCRNRQVDQGDGTFRNERVCDPVYENRDVMGDMCYYSINEWDDQRTVESSGTKAQTPSWPDANLACTGQRLGCERERSRDERYIIQLAGDGDRTLECDVDFDLWQATSVETPFTLDIMTVGGGADCSTLQRAR